MAEVMQNIEEEVIEEIEWTDDMIMFETDCCGPRTYYGEEVKVYDQKAVSQVQASQRNGFEKKSLAKHIYKPNYSAFHIYFDTNAAKLKCSDSSIRQSEG